MINQKINSNHKPKTIELSVRLQYEINALLYYSLPLCIILANEKLMPWYYESFIEIYSHNFRYFDDKYHIEREYFGPGYLCDINAHLYNRNFYVNLADEIALGYDLLKREPDITPFIINQIRNGYYAIVFLDGYYLPERETYRQKHCVHESLIYGFDDREKKFMSIGFDANHFFGMMKLDYRPVSQAFAKGKIYYKDYEGEWAETMAVRLIKPFNFDTEYPFSIHRYLAKLNQYLFANEDPVRMYWLRLPNKATYHVGIAVYDAVLYHLRNMLKGRVSIAPKELHFLYEHKRYLYSSLNYINHRFKIGGDFDGLIDKYLTVVKSMDYIRLIFYKNTLKKRPDLKAVAEMIQKTEKLKEDEITILTGIVAGLNRLIGGR
jgi:hypothetical protein